MKNDLPHTIWLGSFFLAHLSTTSSKGAFRLVLCPSPNSFKTSPKTLGQMEPNLAGMFLGWSSLELFIEFDSIKEFWLPLQPNGSF